MDHTSPTGWQRTLTTAWAAAVLWALPGAGVAAMLHAYNVDVGQTTVSGLSSGAFFAVQFHLAHSALVQGAGIVAGGPYFCAEGDVYKAYNAKSGDAAETSYNGQCMGGFDGPGVEGGLVVSVGADPVTRSHAAAVEAAAAGRIDPLPNLADDKVFISGGTLDPVVVPNVVRKNRLFYAAVGVPDTGIMEQLALPDGHALPVANDGGVSFLNPCGATTAAAGLPYASKSPWLSDCGYDTAGEMLRFFYGLDPALRVPTAQLDLYGRFVAFDQEEFAEAAGARSMAATGYAYVPNSCHYGARCRVHVAFHGCNQTAGRAAGDDAEPMGDKFYRYAGYNNWAANNNIIVLYPQVDENDRRNRRGCWDWWGFEEGDWAGACPGSDAERGNYRGCPAARYHTREGAQIRAVRAMLSRLAGLPQEPSAEPLQEPACDGLGC